jgi:AcrR family transcriptional regulator
LLKGLDSRIGTGEHVTQMFTCSPDGWMPITRREEILEAARRRFIAHGFKKASLSDIASDVGLVKSALYKHFRNKEALFAAAVEEIGGRYRDAVTQAFENDFEPGERIYSAMVKTFEFFIQFSKSYHLSETVWHEIRPKRLVLTAPYKDELILRIQNVIIDGVTQKTMICEKPRVVATMVQLATENLIEQVVLKQLSETRGREALRVAVDTLMNGLWIRR